MSELELDEGKIATRNSVRQCAAGRVHALSRAIGWKCRAVLRTTETTKLTNC